MITLQLPLRTVIDDRSESKDIIGFNYWPSSVEKEDFQHKHQTVPPAIRADKP